MVNTLDKEFRALPFIFLAVETGLIFFFLMTQSPLAAIAGLAGLLCLPFIISSPGNQFLLLILYITILTSPDWGKRYHVLKIYVDWKIVALGMAAIAFLILIRSLFENNWKIKLSFLDKIIAIFFVYAAVNGLWGYAQYGTANRIIIELYYMLLYGAYFVTRMLLHKDPRWREKILLAVLAGTIVASLIYIYLTLSNLDITSIVINRLTTQQPHLAQVALPLLIGALLFGIRKQNKLLSIAAIMPIFLMVIFSQQRGLWVGITVTIFLMLFFYFFRDAFVLSRFIKYILGVVATVVVVFLFLIIAQKYFNLQFLLTVFARVETLSDIGSDTSWQVRFNEVRAALENWKQNMFFGSGLGATYTRLYAERGNNALDNSYAFVLWKLGIAGALLFVSIYITFFIQGLRVFWKTGSYYEKMLVASSLSGMAGMLLIGITNMSIIGYRFNIIWAIFIALVQDIYLRHFGRGDV